MNSEFAGQVHSSDMDWIESMFQRFLNHEALDPSWKYFFEGYQLGQEGADTSSSNHGEAKEELQKRKAQFLRMIYRNYGYLQSQISPLSSSQESSFIQEKIRNIDLNEEVPSLGLLPKSKVSVRDLIQKLKEQYCQNIAVETLTCPPDLQDYVWELMETQYDILTSQDLINAYKGVCKATFFEEFLQVKFTGQKRFSLEGAESLVPMLNYMVDYGKHQKIHNYILGMAHRGRLNVLTNVLKKPYSHIFMEFEDDPIKRGVDHVGDVKYHKGYVYREHKDNDEQYMVVMLPNPSHLEAVDPVIEGVVAALQQDGKSGEEKSSLAILVHGDAAFSGQGIVYETLQLSRIPGYSTEGTLHIVVNNQIGFTAHPRESRSTPYCTDIAKMLGIPVFRVNSEDVSACLRAINYAVQVRQRFGCDVIIDLCCYRKYGHNESDDPSVTAPILYKEIKEKTTVREIFKSYLLKKSSREISEQNLEQIENSVYETLNREFYSLKEDILLPKGDCRHCDRMDLGELLMHEIDVSLDQSTVFHITSKLCGVPDNFTLHPKVKSLLDKRMKMAHGEIGYDWAMAEELAFASLLIEQFSLRLSGQDSIRGTFSQRHLLWSDIKTGDTYSPLYHLAPDQGAVGLYNSPLSEYAVLGFEYGYAQQAKNALVIWEAQFGDFSNGGQIIFDQYISSAIQKWDLHSDLVILLPHGYEGQGPEHSSGRIERYLQLAANWNFQVAIPSTPVQYFRLLREHARRDLSLPLIVFTPKMLLRLPECTSNISEFSIPGGFRPVLEDSEPNYDATTLVLCCGKVYYDYQNALKKESIKAQFACLRIENLYPLYLEDILTLIGKYPKVKQYVWLQEEPRNMGAFDYIFMATQDIFPKKLHCVSRPRSSSTATGSARLSQKELLILMETLFSLGNV
ncbi:oxoglutarate dehydrogenase (succinyl-transferring), E1 component [Chlamydia ibidis]|uniref:oxoglutarate dehydrogenase (succinyl-transferring) n=2 Tax=Chlamydia ibidis TaxID=1405396 RepID=S7J5F5_9CHLA|nr:2-oxoglutarate dehydrogenase E1 component [Chlamydia ibidis]EPP35644.1 oxoglutarate dehydrogenase (succinyl-transferring), E1 component [Chlamydia ibidis]EQM62709.1 oxoglutarate dehydrogenase (succinyl-transferring), E1 component [Chlamydia ibidis 10-1398/6]